MNFNINQESPLEIKVSFQKLIHQYETLKDSDNLIVASTASTILDYVEKHPQLKEEFTGIEQLEAFEEEIHFLLQDLFNPVLTKNEIKTAGIPFNKHVFMVTERFKNIFDVEGNIINHHIVNMHNEHWYIIACSIILQACYGYNLDFRRPFFYKVPDQKGVIKYYKILFNADFIEVFPKKGTPEITKEDYDLLLDNFDNLELWKEKFPLHSYEFKGFLISNIFDVTNDQSISNIKTALIGQQQNKGESFMDNFHKVFQSLLGTENIKVGFTKYNQVDDTFEKVYGFHVENYLINTFDKIKSSEALCSWSYDRLFKEKAFFSISDVDKSYQEKTDAPHLNILKEMGVKSAIFAPIANDNEIMGILEIVSDVPQLLNSVNAQKLVDVMPFIISAVERSKNEEENLIDAIIQKECTSIHPSVHWRFEDEAKKYILSQSLGQEPVFNSISFDNIYPLYGQIDIKGSSDARNKATINDLNLQLQKLKNIFQLAIRSSELPIYQKFLYQINEYIASLNEFFQIDSEHQISSFIIDDLHPVLEHLKKQGNLASEISEYFELLDTNTASFYSFRKEYDESITTINKHMASLLDEKQQEAQAMYPHYYERFKTDGVEHNMYIGESLTKEDNFNLIYLYNLRLWQLQIMCEMENEYYEMQSELKVKLDATSMILVFNQPLSISFRMDEKQFDVDGTYNARYEIVKKRVDKAFIKGTKERVTQKGKISIIYSQKSDEKEYLQYIKFLQSKKYLDTEIEILELQDLQAVSGLKAIRVGVLYHDKQNKEFYSYSDLMSEIG
jgi:hypothetical protein